MRSSGDRINPGQAKYRTVCRIVGPLVFLVGVACVVTAGVDFFTADDIPRLFWLGFVGMPLLFVGSVLLMAGFMGAVARYAAAEQAPVAADTFNYVAGETGEGVRAVASAVREGLAAGARRCAACGEGNDAGAKFCDACGEPLVRVCGACRAENDPDARFCDSCGGALTA